MKSTTSALNDRNHSVKTTAMHVMRGGQKIYGELLTPEGLNGPFPTVILSHGFGNRHELTKYMIGEALARSGWAAFCFDFSGGAPANRSDGSFQEMTIFTEREDLLAVIDAVKALPQTDPGNLFLLGESQGGLVSAISAPHRAEDIRGMVLYYPAFCIPHDCRVRFPDKESIPEQVEIFGYTVGGVYYRATHDYDVYEDIGGYRGPVLILHGDADAIVPWEFGERAARVYENAEFRILPGEPHGWTEEGKRKAAEMSFQFFTGLLERGNDEDHG